jgi:hypothetical protein
MTSTPELTANAGIYLLEWHPENIRICVDRMDDHNHATTGELTIKYKAPESTDYEHLHQARLNLTSTSSRNGLAKYLTERVPEVEWGGVLEQACVKTLAKHREGEPVRMVGNQPLGERPKYLSYPLLLARQPNMIFGPQGSAKTTLALKTALETDVNTLHLDYEWFEDEVNCLTRRLKEGMGLAPDTEIAYRFCSQPLADDILSIQRMVLETQAELVIVDSVGTACGGDLMDPSVILRYFSALRSLRVTTLSIDHVAKENRGPFGSIYKINACRNVWEAVRGTSDDGHLTVGLHHRKLNSGPLLKPLGFKFTYAPDSIVPQKTDARQIPEVLAGMALADQIEAALLRQSMTPAELAEELGKPTSTLSPILSKHKDKFVSLGGGKWGVKAMESDNDVAP